MWKKARFGLAKMGRTRTFARSVANTEERKYLDTTFSAVSLIPAGSVAVLNPIAEGTDFNQRVGRKVRSKYLQYDLGVVFVGGPTVPSDWTIHFILDRAPNGTAGTVAQILDTSIVPATYARKNIQLFQERFKILKTIRGQTMGLAATAYQLESGRTAGYLPLVDTLNAKDDIVHFAGAAAATPNTNAILILVCAQATGANLSLNGSTRWVYVDM